MFAKLSGFDVYDLFGRGNGLPASEIDNPLRPQLQRDLAHLDHLRRIAAADVAAIGCSSFARAGAEETCFEVLECGDLSPLSMRTICSISDHGPYIAPESGDKSPPSKTGRLPQKSMIPCARSFSAIWHISVICGV